MATYDLGTAQNLLTDYTKTRWGADRQLSDGMWSEIGQHVGYQPGTAINDDLLGNASRYVDTIAAREGWQAVPVNYGNDAQPRQAGTGSVPASTGSVPATQQSSSSDMNAIFNSPPMSLNPAQSAAQDAILQLLGRSQQAVTLQDPSLQPVSDAYRSAQQRGVEQQRRALANRASVTGTLNTGGFDTEALGVLQDANRDVASFDANLVRAEMATRRNELLQAIQLAAQTGNEQQRSQLQQQLALLDATLRQQDMSLRDRLGTGDLALRRELGFGDLDFRNRTLTQSGELGRGDLALRMIQSLLQNEQFNSGLGMNAAQFEALLNQNAINTLLGVR